MKAAPTLSALLALVACSSPPATTSFGSGVQQTEDSGAESTAAAASTTTVAPAGSSSGSTTEVSTGEAASSATLPDVGTIPDVGSPLPEGCDGKKIDFLFIISNSGSMKDVQERLLVAFPGFMDAITARDIDKHIMVTTPTKTWPISKCYYCQEDCSKIGSLPDCGAELTICDSQVGAARTFPAGKGASNRRCDLADGRYITEADTDVNAAFECLATVGLDGYDDFAIDAMRAAISPPLNAEGACNEGFLRKDALLMVTIIADSGDVDSAGLVKDWVTDLLAAKYNDPDAVYLFVITTDSDILGHLCWPDQRNLSPTGRYRYLVEAMPNGSIESICAEDYVPFFDNALADILELCEKFVPPQ